MKSTNNYHPENFHSCICLGKCHPLVSVNIILVLILLSIIMVLVLVNMILVLILVWVNITDVSQTNSFNIIDAIFNILMIKIICSYDVEITGEVEGRAPVPVLNVGVRQVSYCH